MNTFKKMFIAVLCVMALSCSENVQNEQSNEQVLAPVTVRVNDFSISQEEFPGTRGKAIGDVAEVKAITLAFYNGSTEVYKHTQFKNDNTTYTTFGEFSTSLPYGDYTMVVLGYNQGVGAQAITLTSPTSATYGEGRVRETFSATQAVSITNSNAMELSATLNRIVSVLAVKSTDNRPEEATHLRLTYAAGGKSFSPTTGLATSNTGFVDLIDFTGNSGSTTYSGSFLFLASNEQTMNVTIETLDADNHVLFSKTIEDVPLKQNRVTRLTGSIYSSSSNVSSGSFQVNDGWLNVHDETF